MRSLELLGFTPVTPKDAEKLSSARQAGETIAECLNTVFITQKGFQVQVRCASITKDRCCAADMSIPPCKAASKMGTTVIPVSILQK